MKKFALNALMVLLTIGFAPATASTFELVTSTETVVFNDVEIAIQKTADNFIILYDTSLSMDEEYKNTGKKKIELEKAILTLRNALLPDLRFNAGLYSFTPEFLADTEIALKTFYPMQPYNQEEFAKAIEQLPTKASGTTLLQQGLTELKPILAGLTGRTVIFVVTDGSYSTLTYMPKPVAIAKELARDNDVCFIAVDSSNDSMAPQILQAVSSINECSRVVTFEQFIENPLTLSGALFVIDNRMIEKSVDIEKIIGAKLGSMLFALNTANIKEEYSDGLKLLGEYMQSNSKAKLVLSGFTDNSGEYEYNLGLSRRRVEAVASYLTKKFNIAPDRIDLYYYGEANPHASNDTREGRISNRRVEGFIYGLD